MPGLGINLISWGNAAINKYGKLIPTPINKKILIPIKYDCVKAAVIAVPTKGAEQGVAIRVAKNPLKKSLTNLLLLFPRLADNC